MIKVPASVKKIAAKGLDANQYVSCNNSIGVRRAKQLVNGYVSMMTIKKMYSYLSRAKKYYTGDKNKCGTVSYWLWGGIPAYRWTKKIINEKH